MGGGRTGFSRRQEITSLLSGVQVESLGNLHHWSCFPPGSHALLARFPCPDQGLPVVVAPASATLVVCRGEQRTTDHLRPFPALAETAWGRTAGTGGRYRTEGRRQQACARRFCSLFEGQQEVRLPLLPLLRAELGQSGQGCSGSPPSAHARGHAALRDTDQEVER
jgi:hypothetical protein